MVEEEERDGITLYKHVVAPFLAALDAAAHCQSRVNSKTESQGYFDLITHLFEVWIHLTMD